MTLPITNRALFVFLVDPEGRILLQLRDSQAPVSPNQWSVPGGQIEAGESPEAAARRELLDETGLRVEGPLHLFWTGTYASSRRPGTLTEWWIYCARTSAQQEDVVVGEGLALEFISP
jgi:8-oxo-dGTP pyrophosphatase MutT (NUDIX family)